MRLTALGISALAGLALTALAMFGYAPTDAIQGPAQKIYYTHVPMAWVAYLAFFVVFIASVVYLFRRDERWDRVGRASGEVGVVFTTLVLITGSLWGRPIWGTWWVWDARLTSTLVLWFIYLAYVMIRTYVTDEAQGARYAAVLGIVGFVDVPIIHLSVTWWRGQHPGPVALAAGGPAMPPAMLYTLLLSLVSFTVFYVYLVQQRLRLEEERAQIRERTMAAEFAGAA
ncbi:MAG: cytochrome c biogenesis protein CcsA [Chloroflexi bacterium]|nr:cytochrome c biogenesis protein CcsA [Chloroflexota bacterium]